MRPRKNEIEAVVKLLENEHDDVETLAGEVITALFRLWSLRTWYTVGTSAEGHSWAWGLYSTPGQAQKAVEKGTVPVLTGARAGVLPIYSEPVETAQNGTPDCSACGHGRHTHNPVPRVRGCVVGRPIKDKAPLRGAPEKCDCEEYVA